MGLKARAFFGGSCGRASLPPKPERKEQTSILKTNKNLHFLTKTFSDLFNQRLFKNPAHILQRLPVSLSKIIERSLFKCFSKNKTKKSFFFYLSHRDGIGASTHAFVLVVVLLSLAFFMFSSFALPQFTCVVISVHCAVFVMCKK